MSTSSPITDITIQHPECWMLDMAVGGQSMQFILYAPSQPDSLIMRDIAFDTALPPLQALENAVYDHPLLLDDYGRVRCVMRAPHFAVVPPEVADDAALAARVLAASFPDDDGEVAACQLPQCEVGVVYSLPKGTQAFLQRTFNTPPMVHHLYPLCEHFKALNTGTDIARMFINLHEDVIDIAVYRQGRLHMANSQPVRNVADATYLVMHTWQSLDMDQHADEIQLTGDKTLRDELAPQLRRYVKYVMPAIFPASAVSLGQNAMQAPFDLILLATCES